jgi:hypothetical protein
MKITMRIIMKESKNNPKKEKAGQKGTGCLSRITELPACKFYTSSQMLTEEKIINLNIQKIFFYAKIMFVYN